MEPSLRARLRGLVGILALAGVLIFTLNVPIPASPDAQRAHVASAIDERLPGWRLERLDPSWEGAYTVVARCAGSQIGFQWVPGHGLPPDDAWLQPNDEYARERLASISDHWRYIVWYDDPALVDELSCSEELAHRGRHPVEGRVFD